MLACHWITIAIILHNLCIDVEGIEATQEFIRRYGHQQEAWNGGKDEPAVVENNDKRQALINELVAIRHM